MFCQEVGEHRHSNSPRLLYGWYFWGLLLAGDPRRKITSGSYPPSRSVQCRTATRNSCAKLASISLTFSLTVNPFLLSFSHCLVTCLFLFFFPPSFAPGCHTVWSNRQANIVYWISNRQWDRKLRGLTKHGTWQILSVWKDRWSCLQWFGI